MSVVLNCILEVVRFGWDMRGDGNVGYLKEGFRRLGLGANMR